MRKFLPLIGLLGLFSLPAAAQVTAVSGTVTDPNGFPYSGASLVMQLSAIGATVTNNSAATCASAGAGSAPCQLPIQGTVGPLRLDDSGSFTTNLYSNTSITPGGTTWRFTVNFPGIPPPIGTGAQIFTVAITITGATQSVSTTLSAAAPKLTNLSTVSGTPCTTRALSFQYNNGGVFGCTNVTFTSPSTVTETSGIMNWNNATDQLGMNFTAGTPNLFYTKIATGIGITMSWDGSGGSTCPDGCMLIAPSLLVGGASTPLKNFIGVAGATSGAVYLVPQDMAGTAVPLCLPSSPGTVGQVLLSGGAVTRADCNANPMTWGSVGGGISGLTTGFIPKAASSTSIANSACDDGITTTSTVTCTEPMAAPSFNAAGLHAGFFQCGPGSMDSAAPALVPGTFQLFCPAGITNWQLKVPAAAGTGLLLGTNSSNVVTTSFIPLQGTDTSVLTSGTVSGTGASLCTDANGGATTSGCSSGGITCTAVATQILVGLTSSTCTSFSTFTRDANGIVHVTGNGSGQGVDVDLAGTKAIGFGGSSNYTISVNTGTGRMTFLVNGGQYYYDGGALNLLSANAITGATSVRSALYATATNCAAVGTSANPSLVACGAAPSGAFSCATTASTGTCVVADTAVTAVSEIFVNQVVSEGANLGVTCNTGSVLPTGPLLLSKTASTGFTITLGTVAVTPGCFDFYILN